jgi:MFS family permease
LTGALALFSLSIDEGEFAGRKVVFLSLKMDLVLLAIYLIYFMACCVYSILAPFYPIVARDKGFGDAFIGILIAIYPLVGIVTAASLAKLILKFGRKELMFFGGLVEVVGVALFGFTIYFDDTAFVVISVVARVAMGMGGSILLTTSMACITFFYPNDNLEAKIGIMEILGSIGILIGPVIGSGLYAFSGYVGTFEIFAGILLFVVVLLAIKNKADQNYASDEKTVEISLLKVAFFPRIVTVLVFIIFGLAGPVYLEAVVANKLKEMGMSPVYIALTFAL